jgi:hypothetical protein
MNSGVPFYWKILTIYFRWLFGLKFDFSLLFFLPSQIESTLLSARCFYVQFIIVVDELTLKVSLSHAFTLIFAYLFGCR